MGMRTGRVAPGLVSTLLLVLVLVARGGHRGAFAQDTTPETGNGTEEDGRPGHVHAGSCGQGDLGDVVARLDSAVAPGGETVGQAGAIPAEMSVTTVPVALTDLLAEDHAIDVHRSAGEIETAIACGEIGGTLDEAGDLAIGLMEIAGSGVVGVAFLSPNDGDPGATDVTLFLVEGAMEAGAVAGGGGPVEITAEPGGGVEAGTDVTPVTGDGAATETPDA